METTPLTPEEIQPLVDFVKANNDAHIAKGVLIGGLTVIGAYAVGFAAASVYTVIKTKRQQDRLAGQAMIHNLNNPK